MLGCRTSNFDRSLRWLAGPTAGKIPADAVHCTTGGEDEDAVGSPFLHWKPFFDCWYAAVVASGGGAARASGRGSSCAQFTNRKPVGSWPSSLMETVPICQLPFFTLQSMGY